MEELKRPAVLSDPSLACCMCKSLIQQSVLLSCLHSCCQRCFSKAASKSSSRDVECSACGYITHTGDQQTNRFLDLQVRRYTDMTECKICHTCQENGDGDEPAILWCTECQRALCEGCLSEHRMYFSNHGTLLLEQLKDFDAMCLQSPAPMCPMHSRLLEIACLDCMKVKCLSCWIECHKNKHEMHVIGDQSSEEYLQHLITSISSMEKTLLQKAAVLEKPRGALGALKAARAEHLKQIEQRKRSVVDAVEKAYEEIEHATKNTYDDLEKEAENAAAAAERIEFSLTGACDYVQRLIDSRSKCDIFDQQKVVQDRLTALSVELEKLSTLISASRNFIIESTLPDNFENLIKSWIGIPQLQSGQSSTPLSSCPPLSDSVSPLESQAPSSVNGARSPSGPPRPLPALDALGELSLPLSCSDFVPTKDGRLLLAAGYNGLIELSSSGQQLSRWQLPPGPGPPDCGDRWTGRDSVMTVAQLTDGAVVVGLHWSRVVAVLLQKGRSSNSKEDDTWIELYRYQIMWRPQRLVIQSGFLAVSGCLRWGTLLLAKESEQVKLAVCNQFRRLEWCIGEELSLDYRTSGLAVTPCAVVTTSLGLVQLGRGSQAQVVDAHSHCFKKRLWRRSDLCEDDEEIKDVCADCAAGVLYAALFRRGNSGGRMASLSLGDGSVLQRVVLLFCGLQQPQPSTRGPTLLLPQWWRLPQRLSLSDEVVQQQGRSRGRPWCVLAVLYDIQGLGRSQKVDMHRRRLN